ncbi:hypothetical protein GOV08_01910 [Candidatus Woesearchaeota archaeon]|nr:hypothetical protein [Candidatus Woesearchaeota archaeon]
MIKAAKGAEHALKKKRYDNMAKKHEPIHGITLDVSTPQVEIEDSTPLYEKAVLGKDAINSYAQLSRIDSSISCAHTIASQRAVESALGINVSNQTKMIRELLLRAELIHSHINFLYGKIIPRLAGAKDYFDYAKKFRKEAQRALIARSKAKRILLILGKRYPHPINSVVGGILKTFDDDEQREMVRLFKELAREVLKTSEFLLKQSITPFEVTSKPLSLWEIDTTPLLSGKLSVGENMRVSVGKFFKNFKPKESYLTGPLARISNNNKLLSHTAEKIVRKAGLNFPLKNIFHSVLCLTIEAVHCAQRSAQELEELHFEKQDIKVAKRRSGRGFCAVESAKGLLYHEYFIGQKGVLRSVKIVSNVKLNLFHLKKSVATFPIDPDKKTRKEIINDISFLVDSYYL